MTKTNSTADHFKNYFIFRLYDGKRIAVISAIMGLLGFVQHSVVLLVISCTDMEYIQKEMLIGFSSILFGVSILAASGTTVYIALSNFEFYINKHKTDMLGSLPISHRERFFADLLSGYILGVLPFVLVSVLSVPFFSAAAGRMFSFSNLFIRYFALVILTVFFALTFLYAISVLSAAISGRIIGAVACGAVLITALETVIQHSTAFFISNITGLSGYDDLARNASHLIPSISRAWSRVTALMDRDDLYFRGQGMTENILNDDLEFFAAGNIVNIIAWVVVIAVIICAAFFLSKHRKAERVGGAFGHKYGYYFILFIMIYTVVIFQCDSYSYSFGLISSAIISAVIFLVFEISMRRGWKNFFVGTGVFAASLAVIAGTVILVILTGAFGLRNKLPEVNEISAVEYNGYKFTDTDDISAFREKHLNILETFKPTLGERYLSTGNQLYDGAGKPVPDNGLYDIKYTLKNGDVVERVYSVYNQYDSEGKKCREAMNNIPVGLKSYNDQVLSKLENSNLDSCNISFKGYIGGRTLKPEKITELIKILNEEQQGRDVGSSDKKVGSVSFVNSEDGYDKDLISFSIYESYTKTIAFITDKNNLMPQDETIDYTCYYFTIYNYSSESGLEFGLTIYSSELSDPNVIELLSLLTEEEPENKAKVEIICYDFYTKLYLPKENMKRFGELAAEIFKTKLEKANALA